MNNDSRQHVVPGLAGIPQAARRIVMALPLVAAVLGSALAAQHGQANADTASPPATEIHWPQLPAAPANAPNILLIMLDDVGFSAPSTYGGVIPTPALDKLAEKGLRFNRFHTAGVCAPSRAALLTGRNPHQVGMGTVPQLAAGMPGYDSVIGKDSATVATVLKNHGYSTAAFGKWHLNPNWETTQAGPFDHWPTGMGFEYYYGCIACLTEWEPRLFLGTAPIPTHRDKRYDLTSDLVDQSIKWIANQKAAAPQKPFFAYLATTATHAPVHAPKEWVDRFRGKFDSGWDQIRNEVFDRQKQLGIIPADAQLAPRPAEFAAWNSLPDETRKLFARQMEAYAGYLAYTDHEVGHLINALDRLGVADNTMVIYIVGDNGASAEGGLQGSITNMAMLQGGGQETIGQQLDQADLFGSKAFDLHFAAGWTAAMDVPFPWMKQVASHLGATRNALVISWPGHTSKPEKIRSQFSYLTDITATIYAAADIEMPETVDDVKQMPLEGKSLLPAFTNPDAAEIRQTQYFSVNNNNSIYHEGWMASNRNTLPWDFFSGLAGSNKQAEWELYDLESDFSQARNIADRYPDKLKQMIAMFDQEARRNNVYPLRPPFLVGSPVVEGPELTEIVYPGEVENLSVNAIPRIDGRSHTITARLSAPEHAQGVIVAAGGRYGGFSLYIREGKLVYASNSLNQFKGEISSARKLPAGELDIRVVIEAQKAIAASGHNAIARNGAFRSGTVDLYVNGEKVGSGSLERFGGYMLNETLDIGRDNGSPVTDDYPAPFTFNGDIRSVTLQVNG